MNDTIIEVRHAQKYFGRVHALNDVSLTVRPREVVIIIGPSGSGKSTLLRSINRINERQGLVRTQGSIRVLGKNILDPDVELVQVRKSVGMVFQRPNPLPISIRDNVLFGHRIHGGAKRITRAQEDEILQQALSQVLLWDQVKDCLGRKATELSLEQQQKLCIARLLPVRPALLLMDEPCSALDPRGTAAVEELIWELRGQYSILIVTHNMAQARRASDECLFMLMGRVLEQATTAELFVTPKRKETANYIEGRYG